MFRVAWKNERNERNRKKQKEETEEQLEKTQTIQKNKSLCFQGFGEKTRKWQRISWSFWDFSNFSQRFNFLLSKFFLSVTCLSVHANSLHLVSSIAGFVFLTCVEPIFIVSVFPFRWLVTPRQWVITAVFKLSLNNYSVRILRKWINSQLAPSKPVFWTHSKICLYFYQSCAINNL